MAENGTEHYQFIPLNQPCEYCKVLELDDAGHGGTIKYKEDGKRFVDFGEVQDTYKNRHAGNFASIAMFAGLYEDDQELITWPKLELKLCYKRDDTLPNLPGFELTGSQGCAFCRILRGDILSTLGKLKENIKDESDNQGNACEMKLTITGISYQLEEDTKDKGPNRIYLHSLQVFFTTSKGAKQNDYYFLYGVYADANDPCASWFQILRRPLPSEHLSPPSLERLNRLVDKSLSETPAPLEQSYHPTRLLDVGSSTFTKLNLIISAEYPALQNEKDPEMKRYAALSYCWGPKDEAEKQLKTTRDTIKDRISQIRFEDLPQTVADAVQVCRSLGIRYLWVDALCIIQDDRDDWAKEAYEMSNVYSHSFITLCIVQGSSCLSGFLKRPGSRQALQINFRSTLDNSVSGKLYLQMLQPPEENIKWVTSTTMAPINNSHLEPAMEDIRDAAWSQRGWTVQEAWLSPRKLFFGNLMFHISCEGLHESTDGSEFHDTDFFPRDEDDFSKVLSEWYCHLVHNYGSRKLTYEQDRFPALSALARTVSEKFPGEQYLAGLWKSDLHRGLLWTPSSWVDLQSYLKLPDDGYIAPTWSWASHPRHLIWMQGINNGLFTYSPEFELTDAKIVTEDLNPYGRVLSGSLDLHAKVFPFSLSKGDVRMIQIPDQDNRWLGVTFHFTLLSEKDEYIASIHLDWTTYGDETYTQGPMDKFWMVLVSRSSLNNIYGHFYPLKDDEYLTDPEIMVGLLLVQTEKEDEFAKVGLWYSETRDLGGSKFWDNIPKQPIRLV